MQFLVFGRLSLSMRFIFKPHLRFGGQSTMSSHRATANDYTHFKVDKRLEGSTTDVDENVEERRIGLSAMEQRQMTKKQPDATDSRLLKVAIIGAPNAGKSTLANKLIGWKFAPVSQKVHTTRHKTLGILTEENKQLIFLDTPGIITPSKMKEHKLDHTLLVDPHSAVFEADLLAVVVDISNVWHRCKLDTEILKILRFHPDKRSILVMNKVDLIKGKRELLNVARTLTEGIVAGTKSWTTAKHQKIDLDSLFAKTKFHQTIAKNSDIKMTGGKISLEKQEALNSNKLFSDCQSTGEKMIPTCQDSEYISNRDQENISKDETSDEPSLQNSVALNLKSDSALNLCDPNTWTSYYRKINYISRDLEDRRGWPHFDEVFMISALSGDGVLDLKEYLLNETYSSSLPYHPSVVTNQDPIALASLCIFERMLDHLPDEIPYQVKLKLALWEVSEDNLLRVSFEVICRRKRHLQQILGKEGNTVRTIAAEAKQQLMNAFRRELSLQLVIKSTGSIYKKDI